MEEHWRLISEYPQYEVSDQGRVRRIKSGRIIKPVPSGGRDKRNTVSLRQEGKQHKVHVARLVLTAFVRLPEPGEMALHKDDDIRTDRLEQLRWGRHQDNVEDARVNKRYRSPKYWEGKTMSPEHREKLSAALRGRSRPPEVVAKLGVGSKRAWQNPEHRERILSVHRGAKRSVEARENMSRAQRARWRRENGEE